MLRELDQRHSDQLTVTLEWDPDTDDVWVRAAWRSQASWQRSDSTTSAPSFANLVHNARPIPLAPPWVARGWSRAQHQQVPRVHREPTAPFV
jgi:hypothetical protein